MDTTEVDSFLDNFADRVAARVAERAKEKPFPILHVVLVAHAAKYLGCTVRQVHSMIRTGAIPASVTLTSCLWPWKTLTAGWPRTKVRRMEGGRDERPGSTTITEQ